MQVRHWKTAELFMAGGAQAVRLPEEFRFDTTEVYVRRDASTGDVILSTRPSSPWQSFMDLRAQLGPIAQELVAKREQGKELRDPFDGWTKQRSEPSGE